MTLYLTRRHLKQIQEHLKQGYPYEACGILVGASDANGRTVVEVLPTGNGREENVQHKRYTIPPEDLLWGELRAEHLGMEVIGYFHSHPDHTASPSEVDRELAWPNYSYLIASVRQGRVQGRRSWRLREDRSRFDEEPVVVVDALEQ